MPPKLVAVVVEARRLDEVLRRSRSLPISSALPFESRAVSANAPDSWLSACRRAGRPSHSRVAIGITLVHATRLETSTGPEAFDVSMRVHV